MKLSSDLTCNWSANHGFLLCDQIIHLPDGTQNDFSVYTYSEKDHAYQFFGITRGNKEPRTTKLTIEGNLWTYSSSDTSGGKNVQYRTTNRFTTASKVEWRSEYSEDGTHWTTTAEGTDARANESEILRPIRKMKAAVLHEFKKPLRDRRSRAPANRRR